MCTPQNINQPAILCILEVFIINGSVLLIADHQCNELSLDITQQERSASQWNAMVCTVPKCRSWKASYALKELLTLIAISQLGCTIDDGGVVAWGDKAEHSTGTSRSTVLFWGVWWRVAAADAAILECFSYGREYWECNAEVNLIMSKDLHSYLGR